MIDTSKQVVLALVALAGAALWLPACGGGSSGADLACSLNIAGQKYCYAYSDLSSDNTKTAKSACSNQSGTLVNSCPTDGLVGCCEISQSGVSYQACSYSGTASANEMACTGKWTSGSAGLGSPGGGGSGGSSTSSSTPNTSVCTTGDPGCACYPNKTCNGTLTCTSGICAYGSGNGGAGGGGGGSSTPPSTCGAGSGLCCPGNYCSVGTAKGYQFAYSDRTDGGGSSASLVGTDKMCVSGTAMGALCDTQSCFSTHWGGGLGINLNQAQVDGSTPMNFTGAGSSGVTYSVDNFVQGMRLVVGDSNTDYCVNLNSGSGTIPWRSFNSACWDGLGTSLSGPPADFTSIRFQVAADAVYGINIDFNFCVLQLSL